MPKKTNLIKKKYHHQLDNWTFSFLFASFKERGARYALSQLPKVRKYQTNIKKFGVFLFKDKMIQNVLQFSYYHLVLESWFMTYLYMIDVLFNHLFYQTMSFVLYLYKLSGKSQGHSN